jgi:hypothetical protein
MVRDTPGELLLPLSQAQGDMTEQQLAEAAGCDLNEDVPELLKWISSEAFKFSAVTIGCYVYMDGECCSRALLLASLSTTAAPTHPHLTPLHTAMCSATTINYGWACFCSEMEPVGSSLVQFRR